MGMKNSYSERKPSEWNKHFVIFVNFKKGSIRYFENKFF